MVALAFRKSQGRGRFRWVGAYAPEYVIAPLLLMFFHYRGLEPGAAGTGGAPFLARSGHPSSATALRLGEARPSHLPRIRLKPVWQVLSARHAEVSFRGFCVAWQIVAYLLSRVDGARRRISLCAWLQTVASTVRPRAW